MMAAFATIASANPTGNPGLDGWQAGGNSMANGTYIRGAGNFGYTTYISEFTVAAGHNFNSIGTMAWNVGDQVIGIGGVIDHNTPIASLNGWSGSYTGVATNANLQSASSGGRMVSKFGASASAWSASTIKPGSGNGLGSDSSGHGGTGSVLIANSNGDFPSTASGTLRLPSVFRIYDGASSINLDAASGIEVGRLIYNWSVDGAGFNVIDSWQALLNVTLLNSLNGTAALGGNTFADLPTFGDRHNIAMQRGSGDVTDALIQANPVPEPATMVALGIGAAAVIRRRTRK